MTVMRSATRNTRSMSWSMMSTPMSRGRLSIASRMMWLSALGTPAAGSSSSRPSGFRPSPMGSSTPRSRPSVAPAEPRGPAARAGRHPERLEQVPRLFHDVAARAGRPKHRRGCADPFGDRDAHIFENRKPAEQTVDLERPGDAELDPLRLRDLRDVSALQQNNAGRRRDDAGYQIHKRRLAGAVGADQRVPRAGLEPEIDVTRGGQRAEVPAQRARLEEWCGHDVAPGRSPRPRASA